MLVGHLHLHGILEESWRGLTSNCRALTSILPRVLESNQAFLRIGWPTLSDRDRKPREAEGENKPFASDIAQESVDVIRDLASVWMIRRIVVLKRPSRLSADKKASFESMARYRAAWLARGVEVVD